MIQSPHTYSEWVSVLEIFKKKTDDKDVVKAMKTGTIEWQSGVAERFSQKIIDSVNFRMNAASDKFQLELSRAYGSEGAIVRAILALRKEMIFLRDAIDLPVFPDKDRQRYVELVIEQADSMQKSLEDSARKERSGKLLSIVRNHKVNMF